MQFDFRPVSQETYHITNSTEDGFEGVMWLGKGSAGPPVHIHPYSTEELELIEGKLNIFRNGTWELIEAGTKWIIPSGEPHTFKSVPESEARVKFKFFPGKGFEGFLKDTEDLIRSGKFTSYSNLNGLMYSSMLISKYKDTLRPSSKGMCYMMKIITLIGKMMGKKV